MEPLFPGCYYHIYNHAIGKENLFIEDKNYLFFLRKLQKYVTPVAETYVYCLMPNHFHFLMKIKNEDDILPLFKDSPECKKVLQLKSISLKEAYILKVISKQFSHLFSSYTQACNGMYSRMGSLFMKNFKRKPIEDEDYFIRVINYIHFNPVEHGFVNKPSQRKYSSYNAIVSQKPTMIKREQVLQWFGGLGNFMYCHLRPMEL